eukprot:752934-Amphidinium_carterae.1
MSAILEQRFCVCGFHISSLKTHHFSFVAAAVSTSTSSHILWNPSCSSAGALVNGSTAWCPK